MRTLFQQCWHDDTGAVVSVELLLILTILVFGTIPGLIAVRNSVNATLTTLGNLMTALIPSFTFSGFAITGQDQNGNTVTVLQVGGVQFTPNRSYLTADQLPPTPISSNETVPPAP